MGAVSPPVFCPWCRVYVAQVTVAERGGRIELACGRCDLPLEQHPTGRPPR